MKPDRYLVYICQKRKSNHDFLYSTTLIIIVALIVVLLVAMAIYWYCSQPKMTGYKEKEQFYISGKSDRGYKEKDNFYIKPNGSNGNHNSLL